MPDPEEQWKAKRAALVSTHDDGSLSDLEDAIADNAQVECGSYCQGGSARVDVYEVLADLAESGYRLTKGAVPASVFGAGDCDECGKTDVPIAWMADNDYSLCAACVPAYIERDRRWNLAEIKRLHAAAEGERQIAGQLRAELDEMARDLKAAQDEASRLSIAKCVEPKVWLGWDHIQSVYDETRAYKVRANGLHNALRDLVEDVESYGEPSRHEDALLAAKGALITPDEQAEHFGTVCGRVGVGRGSDSWDPVCDRPSGHDGPCNFTGEPSTESTGEQD